jgi:hypothetical protein
MRPQSVEELAQAFVAAVVAARDAYSAGDVPTHNRWWQRTDRIARNLIDRSGDGKKILETLLAHKEPSVRLSAASYVRRWAPGKAVPVLEDLLLWAKRDRSREIYGEAIQVIVGVKGLLAQEYGVNVLDVEALVHARREGVA